MLMLQTPSFQELINQAVQLIMPEMILTLFACAALVLDVMLPRDRKQIVAWVSLAGVGVTLVSLGILYFGVVRNGETHTGFYDMIVVDNYAVVFKLMFLIGTALSILLSIKYLEVEGEQRGEYYSLILFSVVGMMFMASAVDLLSLFISLELMAISVYILVGYLKRDRKSNEASMKYFLLGAFSSGVLLYGISMIYGLTGTTNLAGIAKALPIVAVTNWAPLGTEADMRYFALLAMVLMATGMFFKVAAVPFHMWAPDAYEGAPTSITAFMSVGVKAASFAMFGRLFLYGLPDLRTALEGNPATNIPGLPGWAVLLGVIAAITIVWGNLAALTQQNTKRLLAYSFDLSCRLHAVGPGGRKRERLHGIYNLPVHLHHHEPWSLRLHYRVAPPGDCGRPHGRLQRAYAQSAVADGDDDDISVVAWRHTSDRRVHRQALSFHGADRDGQPLDG